MQDLEHNIDDLFRKAAEEYPLKTGDSRWDDIAAKMANAAMTPTVLHKNKYSKQERILLLLLLLFLFAVGVSIEFSGSENGKSLIKKGQEIKNISKVSPELHKNTSSGL